MCAAVNRTKSCQVEGGAVESASIAQSDHSEASRPSPVALRTPTLTIGGAVVAMVIGLFVAFVIAGEATSDPRVVILLFAGPVGAALGILAVTRFEYFVLVALVVRPSLDVFRSGDLGPGPMLAAVFMSTAAVWLIVQYRSKDWQPFSIAAKCLLFFAGATTLAVLTSSLRVVSAVGALEIVAGITMFLVLEQLLPGRPDRVRRLVIAVLLSGVVPLLVGVNQWLGSDVVAARTDLGRIQATFVHPNPFAMFLVMLILLTTSLATVSTGRHRAILAGYLGLLTVMLVVTYHRASWIAILVGLMYIGARWNRRMLAVLAIVVVGLALTVPSVGSRIGDLSDEKELPDGVPENSLEWRFQYWGSLIPMADESPLTGIGPQVVLNARPEGLEPHNIFVQSYVEMGAFGLIGLVSVVGGVAMTLSRRRRAAVGNTERALAVGAIAVALAVLTLSPSENVLNQTMSWWYMAAGSTWGYRRSKSMSSPITSDVKPSVSSSPIVG